jgi:hypothetical protein
VDVCSEEKLGFIGAILILPLIRDGKLGNDFNTHESYEITISHPSRSDFPSSSCLSLDRPRSQISRWRTKREAGNQQELS